MAEVDDVIRAAVAAGELIVHMTEWAVKGGQGIRSLVQHLISQRGGAASQVESSSLPRPLRAQIIPAAKAEDLRKAARSTGAKFALVEHPDEAKRILVFSQRDAFVMEDLCSAVGAVIEDAPVPDMESAKDKGMLEDLSSIRLMEGTVSPEDAASFLEEAAKQDLPLMPLDGAFSPSDCILPDEMPFEAFQDRMHKTHPTGPLGPGFPGWQDLKPSSLRVMSISWADHERLRANLPGSVPLGSSSAGRSLITAFRAADEDKIRDILPDAAPRRLVTVEELRDRFCRHHKEPCRYIVSDAELGKVQDLLKSLNIAPAGPFREAAYAEKICRNLKTRIARAVRHGPSVHREHTCTLSETGADQFRVAAITLGVPYQETRQGTMVRFSVAPEYASRASALLAGAGLEARFAPPQSRAQSAQGR